MFLELKKPGEVQVTVPPIRLEPWRQLLIEASDLLERRGWCQQHLIDVRGRMCTMGAMTAAWNPVHDWNMDVVAVAQSKLHELVGPVVEWNDEYGRTQDQVVETLRYVANQP